MTVGDVTRQVFHNCYTILYLGGMSLFKGWPIGQELITQLKGGIEDNMFVKIKINPSS